MKRTRILLLVALGLTAAALRADDPTPARVLSLDATGHPRADLNLSSSHVTGTLDAARLPAGIGSAFLAGVDKPTGSDATALDHVPVTGINAGEVRQMVFTSGLTSFAGGVDSAGAPFTYAAATYRLVATPAVGGSSVIPDAPDTIPTPTTGKVWRLVSAAMSNGDVVLPNQSVLALGAGINQGQSGGSIDTSNGGGGIRTSNHGGAIRTSDYGGSIDVSYGGGSIDASSSGGSINTASGGGSIDTSFGGGTIRTNGYGSPEGVVIAPTGSLYCDQNGTADHVLYVKESGTGDTGWVAK